MIIIVAGNIAAGKSEFARALAKCLPDFTVLGIDDFRNIYKNESIAQTKLLSSFFRYKNIIYETTTCNRIHFEIMNSVLKQGHAIITIRIACPVWLCKSRFEARVAHAHFDYKIEIEKSLAYIEHQLRYFSSDLLFDSSLVDVATMVAETLAFIKMESDVVDGLEGRG